LDLVEDITKSIWTEARFFRANSVSEIHRHFAICRPDLAVTDIAFADGDAFGELHRWSNGEERGTRIVLLTRWCDLRTAELAQAINANAAIHLSGASKVAITEAMTAAHGGRSFWCPAFRAAVIEVRRAVYLTANEKLVLTIIGDGSDDRAAAERLGISSASVLAVRRALHRKLKLQHRGELIRAAHTLGYVRFIGGAVVRAGLELMIGARASRPPRSGLGNA
jgi:DNA-binding NarL/FixJ family response regulator